MVVRMEEMGRRREGSGEDRGDGGEGGGDVKIVVMIEEMVVKGGGDVEMVVRMQETAVRK